MSSTNFFKVQKGIVLVGQASAPASPDNGSIYYDTVLNKFQKYENGVWSSFGGSSGINYIGNPDAEAGTSGWATFADAAASRPVDGTGGSPSSTFTQSTSSPLRGTANFLWTKSAANRQGEGFSRDFTIDRADLAKPLQISFDYEIASGTYSGGTSSTDSDLIAYIYDVTNSTLIEPSGIKLDGGVVGVQCRYRGTFQTSATGTSYRLIVFTATTSASAYTVKFDNFFLGPQVTTVGAVETDWASNLTFSPSAGFGTTTNSNFWWRLIGDTMFVKGNFRAGTLAASDAYIGLPGGYSIDPAKTTTSPTNTQTLGIVRRLVTAAGPSAASAFVAIFDGTNTDRVYIVESGGSATYTKQNPSSFMASNDALSFEFSFPVLGRSSNTLVSTDTDTRVVALRINGNPAAATTGNPIIIPTATFDTHGAYNATTGRYTAPVAGIYAVSGVLSNFSAANIGTFIYKNAVLDTRVGTSSSGNSVATISGTIKLVAGDIIDLRNDANFDGDADCNISIFRLSGPSQIAASEVIAVRASLTANQSSGTGDQTIVFDSKTNSARKEGDTHGAYNATTGIFTAPAPGWYLVSTHVTTTAVVSDVGLYLADASGTQLELFDASSGGFSTRNLGGSTLVKLNSGDTLKVVITRGVSTTVSGDVDARTTLNIVRQGGVQ